ncbi:hypothetical protein [Ancylobacter sp. IITR112]|uniref:hypothetical protein n=1 Tax=Ancylobacter sp. IITR112 TaxID=3138073 RepID=UPI00352BADB2
MVDPNKINENLPSSADALMRDTGRNMSAAADSVRDGVHDAAERASGLYAAGNAAVANRIDVLPGMVTAALAGVVVGYFIGRDHHHRRW